MIPTNRSLMGVLVLAAFALSPSALSPSAQSNDVPLNNGGDIIFFYSSPSVGSTLGPGGPVYGDIYWRTLPGDRLLADEHGLGAAQTMEIDGFYESLFDTDWTTSPSFYDRVIGPALPVPGLPCALEPGFFQAGLTSEVTVVIGPSGFGSPCTIVPSLCSCPIAGFIPGYIVNVQFGSTPGSGIVVPADGTSSSDLAITYLVPGGMVATGGACGLGDYTLQSVYSIDETQADDCSGVSAFGGFYLPGVGPISDTILSSLEQNVTFREPILNVIADSGGGFGVEQGSNGGGALNGLKLDTSSGAATLGAEIRDLSGVGQRAIVLWSRVPLGPPGSSFLGGYLLVGTELNGPACFHGGIVPTVYTFTSEAALTTCQVPVPAVMQPTDVYWQGVIVDTQTRTARNTNRVRTTLY